MANLGCFEKGVVLRTAAIFAAGAIAWAVIGIGFATSSHAAPQGPWMQPASTLSTPSPLAGGAKVAVGPDGTTTAVWSWLDPDSGDQVILMSTRPLKGEWSTPAKLTTVGIAGNPELAVAPNGATTAIWQRHDGTTSRIESVTRSAAGVFGPTQVLTDTDPAFDPHIAAGPHGELVAVWVRAPAAGGDGTVRYRNLAADGSPANFTGGLSATGEDADSPRVVIDSDGAVTVVWVRGDGNGGDIIQASTRPANQSSFGNDIELSAAGQDGYLPDITVSTDGTTAVVWSDVSEFTVFASVREPGSNFPSAGQASVLSNNDAYSPTVAFGPGGVAHVAWSEVAGSDIRVRTTSRPSEGEFPPPAQSVWIPDEGNTGLAYFPDIKVAPDGTTTVIWTASAAGDGWVVRGSTRSPNGDFLENPVTLSGVGDDEMDPQLAIGPNGTATAVWTTHTANKYQVETTSTRVPAYNLDVTMEGTGLGTVISNPIGINCGDDCSETLEHGTVVSLTAAASANSSFSGWGGACAAANSSVTCEVAMTQARSVVAMFKPNDATQPPKPEPTPTTAVFDGKILHIKMLCPSKFSPKCVSNAVPVTSKKLKTVKGKKRPVGKPLGTAKKVTTLSGKWRKVSFLIKPAYRAKIQKMVGTGKRTLHVRQTIRSKRINSRKSLTSSWVFHSYKVRAG